MTKNNKTFTGLVWEGKRTEIDRVALPFQVVETVNEPRKQPGELSMSTPLPNWWPAGWRNRLIWGDNKYIMASLLEEFAGKVNLIYIDPPFATGADFSINMRVGDLEWTKEASVIEEKAYRDTWGRGLDSYLQMMYDRLVLMRELLADNGSIYVHLDYHVGHYVKIILDEIFGKESFRNQIVWYYTNKIPDCRKRLFTNATDYLLFYTRGKENTFNVQYDPREVPIRVSKMKKVAGKKVYEKDETGKGIYIERTERMADNVWQIPLLHAQPEILGFPTQKPEALLERVINASSNEGDLVADLFCGSGTTLSVAEKLGRRWIGSDLSKFAIHTTRKRLLDIPDCRPFEVLNLGRYQREKLRQNGNGGKKYYKFILDLYKAQPIEGYMHLQGKKAGRMIHIGSVDSMVTEREIKEAVSECQSIKANGLDVPGWDFEMGLHDLVDKIGQEYGVKIRLVQIPRESLEVKNPAREEVKFFDLNYLELEYTLS